MQKLSGNIEKLTLNNKNYRKVLATTKNMQLVLMRLKPGEEIGMESHPHTTQFIRVESGSCKAITPAKTFRLKADSYVIIPPKTKHNIVNTSKDQDLMLYTIYSPPEHPRNCVQRKKPLF